MKHYRTDTLKKWGMIEMAFLACILWHPACVSGILAETSVKYLTCPSAHLTTFAPFMVTQ